MTITTTSSTAAPAATGRDSDQLSIRLPEGMRETLKAGAAMHRRTLNAEVVAIIEAGMVAPTTSGSILGPIPGKSTTSLPAGPTSAPTPAPADFTQLSNHALQLAKKVGIEIVGNADGFNALRDGEIISRDCSAVEIEKWLDGFFACIVDAAEHGSAPSLHTPTQNLPHFAEIDATNLGEAGRFGMRVIDFDDNFGINYEGNVIDEGMTANEVDQLLQGFLIGVDHFDAEKLIDELSKAEQIILALMAVLDDEQKQKAAASLTALGFNPDSAARCPERHELLIQARARGAA